MMTNNQNLPPTQNLSLGDIYYVLFRHKWKIILCTLAGFAAAGAMFRTSTPPYQSEARLLVRYIDAGVEVQGPAGGGDPTTRTKIAESLTAIMNTETEILNSVDLAKAVAEAFGAEKILAKSGGGKDPVAAAAVVRNGLRVIAPPATPVLHLTFRHPDSEIVNPLLATVIERYLKRHVEAHRGETALSDQQTQELDELRTRLLSTEDEYRRETAKAGVSLSLEKTKEDLVNQMTANRREVAGYEAEVASRIAVLEELKKRLPAGNTTQAAAEPDIPLAVLEEHKRLYDQAARLQGLEQDLLAQFTPGNPRVKDVQTRLTAAREALNKLRQEHPRLVSRQPAVANAPAGPDPDATEILAIATQITAYQAKIKELTNQFEKLRADLLKVERSESLIMELRRRQKLEEQHYLHMKTKIEALKLEDRTGRGRVSGIKQIQSPSPAFREQVDFKKIGLCAVAGIVIGLAWAFLVELYLDRSIRRPSDLAKILKAPLFLSIPKMKVEQEQLALNSGEKPATDANGSLALVPAGQSPRKRGGNLDPFHETLRDRLINYFESRNLTHKPKLVAVTALSADAGVTTTAAGLARSLSETGEGNVLLVDMTVGEGAAKQFVKGREACGLDELLEARSQGRVHDNLYVVTENNNSERLSRNLPLRFSRLIPKLKASDFDYIIFDMPVVNQLSITPRLAGFMDMVLLVVESETTDRDMVQGACAMLAESKAHVGVVLNKTRHYVPGRLNQELMST